MMPQPVRVLKAFGLIFIFCVLVSYRDLPVAPQGEYSQPRTHVTTRAVAMTCPSKPDNVHNPIVDRWIHNPADPYLGIGAVADELVNMHFSYPMYVLSFANEHDATRRCQEIAGSSTALGSLVTCLELPQEVPKGYGYAKIDAMVYLSTNTDVDEVIFLDCDAFPVSNLTDVFTMLNRGAAWGSEMWHRHEPRTAMSNASNSSGGLFETQEDAIGDEVAAVFWADMEGHYDMSYKLIERKYAELHIHDVLDERAPIDRKKYYETYHMKLGCDTGIMLVNLRRSQSTLKLLLELKNDKSFQKASYGDKDLWRIAYYLTGTPFRLAPYVGGLGLFDMNQRYLFASQAKHDDSGNLVCVHQLWYPSRHEVYYRSMAAIAGKKAATNGGKYAPHNVKRPTSTGEKRKMIPGLFDTFEGYYWDKLDPHPTNHLGARVHIRFSLEERPNYLKLYNGGSWIRWSQELNIDELSITPNQVLVKVYALAQKWGYPDFAEFL